MEFRERAAARLRMRLADCVGRAILPAAAFRRLDPLESGSAG
jgi:hypothetical protein